MEVLIRDMHINDVSTIIKYDLIMLGETLGEKIIKNHINNSDLTKYFVMENKDNKEIIGQMSLWIDIDKAQINNFYILKKYQKQNLGKKFLRYIINYLYLKNIKEITLEVRKSNISAIKLYELFDFKVVSIRKNYYSNGEDAYLMYLRIGSE